VSSGLDTAVFVAADADQLVAELGDHTLKVIQALPRASSAGWLGFGPAILLAAGH
jgi:hypothetical protein